MKAKSLNNPICHLGEGPLWNVEQQTLYWTDILEGRLWKYVHETGKISVVWEGDHKIGGFAFSEDGGIVLCTHKGVYKLQKAQLADIHSIPERIVDIPMASTERFNDITTDPKGRIYAGTKFDDNKNGTLYRIEKGKEPVAVLTGLGISNGMTFSNDLKYFFHTDSVFMCIKRYDYDLNTGNISNPAVFYQGVKENGFPDGITIDTEDHIWVAFWSAGKARRLNKEGHFVEEIEVDALQPSSVMFGGKEMNELFITSACEGGADLKKGLDAKGRFLGGHVYRALTNHKGRPEWPTAL